MKTLEMIKVMQAAEAGERIQSRERRNVFNQEPWISNPKPLWDWLHYEYRVAPKEPREIFLAELNGRLTQGFSETKEPVAAAFAHQRIIRFREVIEE